MKKVQYYIFLSGLLIIAGCKKNNLPPAEENKSEPVFYFKGNVNGAPVALQAGVNNYFMYSSHYQQANNVYVYKGEMKQSLCNGTCGYGITLLINDYKVSQPDEPMKPDSGLYVGHYQLNDGSPDPVTYSGSFTPLFTDAGTTYSWWYSDGVILSGLQGGSRYFNAGQTYSVALSVTRNNATQTHTNEFRVGNPLQTNVGAYCNWTTTPTTYSFVPYLSSTAGNGITYNWDFGDASPATANSVPVHAYYYGSKYFRARLRLTNSNNDTCYSYYQVPVSVTTPTIHANFNSVFNPVPNVLGLSSITLLVTDPSGTIYSTESINQSVGNNIQIVSVEDYKNNSANEPTKKLKITFNCVVKNGADVLNITNGEAVIAVSYHN
ncbi:MAG: hypothetical protein ACXVO9_03290 [Bacteroidia bacterium]